MHWSKRSDLTRQTSFCLRNGLPTQNWQASRNGYKLVLAPEGVPQVSVNWYALAAPVLGWIGLGLLVYRLAGLGLLCLVAWTAPAADWAGKSMRRSTRNCLGVVWFNCAGRFVKPGTANTSPTRPEWS